MVSAVILRLRINSIQLGVGGGEPGILVAGPSGAGVFTGGALGFCISFPCKFILVLLQNKKDNFIIVGIFILSRQIEIFIQFVFAHLM